MEVDEATIVTASTKRGASEDPQDAAKRLRTDDADAMDEAAARTRAEMTPAEREEAERLHRTAVRAEARSRPSCGQGTRSGIVGGRGSSPQERTGGQAQICEQERTGTSCSRKDQAKRTRARTETQERAQVLGAPLPRKEPSIKKAIDDYAVLREKKPVAKKDTDKERELAQIRENYLGKKGKKKQPKPSEKFARVFQFDWDANDDTSQDLNPLYARRHADTTHARARVL